MTYIGLGVIAIGIVWWLLPSRTQPAVESEDDRMSLFDAFLEISDHVESVGTPEQKAALLTVLPAILAKVQ